MLRLKPTAAADPESVAIAGLRFIAGDGERLARFLDITGLTPQTLRATAGEPQFLARVLDYIAEDETLLLAFAANENLAPQAVAHACQALSQRAG